MSHRPEDSEYQPTSDVDLWHVMEGDPEVLGHMEVLYQGVLLELAGKPLAQFADAETVLTSWVNASQLRMPGVIHDPTGRLTAIQREVAYRFAEPRYLRARCAGNTIRQLPLVAAGQPPTFRRSAMLFTNEMIARGHGELADGMLEYIGSIAISRTDAERLLEECRAAFDRAIEVRRSPVPFDFKLCLAARSIYMDGCRELIDAGYPREAVWWIHAAHYIAHNALERDAPQTTPEVFLTCQ